VDPQLKGRMTELSDAINKSLSDSEQISEVVSRIKDGGYDIFLAFEATIGLSKTNGVSKEGKEVDMESFVSTASRLSAESARWVGKNVRVVPIKPDGTPHPSAGKTGRVRKVLHLGTQMHAVVEVDNDFIVVSVESLEILQQPTEGSHLSDDELHRHRLSAILPTDKKEHLPSHWYEPILWWLRRFRWW
jgi:hypothetical protein